MSIESKNEVELENKVNEVSSELKKSETKNKPKKLNGAIVSITKFILTMMGIYAAIQILPIPEAKKEITLAVIYSIYLQSLLIYEMTKEFNIKLKFNKLSLKETGEVAFIGTAVLIANILLTYLFTLIGPLYNDVESVSLASIDSKIILFVFAAIIAPTTEEILFRVIPYELYKRKGTKSALIKYFVIPGVAFSILHFDPSFTPLALLLRTINTLCFAFLTAYIYHKKENITYNIAIHSVHNGIIILIPIIASAL